MNADIVLHDIELGDPRYWGGESVCLCNISWLAAEGMP